MCINNILSSPKYSLKFFLKFLIDCLDTESKGLQPSNSTKEFKKFYEETNSCLSNHYDPSNKTYNKDVCQNCSSVYFRMNKFYSDLKEHSGNGLVCMDIVDTVCIP